MQINVEILKLEENSYHIFVSGAVNGNKCRILIDTGASKTIFDKVFLNSISPKIILRKNNRLSNSLGSNTLSTELAMLENFCIGDKMITDYDTVVIELLHVNQSYEAIGQPRVDAILGGDILNKYLAVINYKEKIISLD